MKALIHNGRVVELHETGFPVHESMQWVDAPNGVTTEWRYENGEFVAPIIPQLTTEEIIAELDQAVVDRLTETARVRGYGDSKGLHPLLSIASYDNDKNPRYAMDAFLFKNHRSEVWDLCNQIKNECMAGIRQIPTKDELLSMLPVLRWND